MRVKIPLHKIIDPSIVASGVNLWVLRLDLTHPYISGNKFFKLKYNLEEAKKQKQRTLLTFGGAYSNHIAATAAAGKEYGFGTVGIIRGEELEKTDNPTLRFAKQCGMKLHFVSREEYRKSASPEFIADLRRQLGDFYLLPEGGTNDLAVKGCAEIPSLIDSPFDFVCCPVGTGGTLAGIISSLKVGQQALGFSTLYAPGYLMKEVQNLLSHLQINASSNFQLEEGYHFEGYARHNPELLKFIDDFEKQNSIPLEHVYTGKMMFGIYDLIGKGHFRKGSTIVAVHTGGLQGKLPPLSGSPQGESD